MVDRVSSNLTDKLGVKYSHAERRLNKAILLTD